MDNAGNLGEKIAPTPAQPTETPSQPPQQAESQPPSYPQPPGPASASSRSTASLPNLHRLVTIHEGPPTIINPSTSPPSVPAPAYPTSTTNTIAPAASSRRNTATSLLRYPVTPYPATPATTFPYVPSATSGGQPGQPSPAFFIWPGSSSSNSSSGTSPFRRRAATFSATSIYSRRSSSGRKSNRKPPSFRTRGSGSGTDADVDLEAGTTKKAEDENEHTPTMDAAPHAAVAVTAEMVVVSPTETEITREFQHEARLAEKRRREELPRRLATALAGGTAVIVPMVIMSLGRSLVKSLVTSSVAVILFGVALAWTSTADEASLLVATAGYAAVLAVFVALGDGP